LTKEFKGFTAVNDVNLQVQRGHIHALIGPNGAGKTTCFNLLTKFLVPTSGQILFNGRDITFRQAGADRAHGHHPFLPDFRRLPAPDRAAERAHRPAAPTRHHFPFLAQRALAVAAERARHGSCWPRSTSPSFADTITADLPYGRKRALEIATTLAMEPELMLLDEPTQGMGHEDVHRVTELIKKVSNGRTILMVEHNMNVVSGICDKISVLQRGAMLAEGSYAEVSKNPQVMEAYMGTEATELVGAH
jgi:branched-chain amino acid transport system ATP-binding protein